MLSTLASDHTQVSPPVITLEVNDDNDGNESPRAVSMWPPLTRSPFASPMVSHSSMNTLTPNEWHLDSGRAGARSLRTRFAASRSLTQLNKTHRRRRRVADLHVFMGLLMSVVGAGMLSVPYTSVALPTAHAIVGVVAVGAAMACTATALLFAHVEVVSAEEKRRWRTRALTHSGNVRSDRGGFGVSGIGGVRVNGVDVRVGVDRDSVSERDSRGGSGAGVAGSKCASLPALARRAGGDAFALVVALVTACGIFGGCVGGLRLVRDLTPHIVSLMLRSSLSSPSDGDAGASEATSEAHSFVVEASAASHSNATQHTVEIVVLCGALALVVLPLCLLKNLSALKVSSCVGFVLSLYLVLAFGYRSLDPPPSHEASWTASGTLHNGNASGSGLLVSSFSGGSSSDAGDGVVNIIRLAADRDARTVASFALFARAVSIYNFAFMMHLNLLPLFVQLRVSACDKATAMGGTVNASAGSAARRIRPIRTARSRMAAMVSSVACLCVLLYISLGVYGAAIKGNMLLSLQRDRAMAVPLVAFYVTVLVTLPLLFHPLRCIVEELVFKNRDSGGDASSGVGSGSAVATATRSATPVPTRVRGTSSSTSATASAISFVDISINGSATSAVTATSSSTTVTASNEEEEATLDTSTDVSFARRLAVTLALLGSALAVATHVSNVEVIFSLVGATTCTLVCFAFPVAIFTRVFPWRQSTASVVCTAVLWLIVLFEAVLGLVVIWSLAV